MSVIDSYTFHQQIVVGVRNGISKTFLQVVIVSNVNYF